MKLKKCLSVSLVFLLLFSIFITSNIYAAGSFSVRSNTSSLQPGQTTSLVITTSNCAGKFNISSSNNSVATVSTASTWADGTATITITAKANGTAAITVTPVDVSDSDLNDVLGSKSVTISVSTPTTPPPSGGGSTGSGSNNTKPNNNTNTNASAKSSNAYLSSLVLSEEGIEPMFSKNITAYKINVPEAVKSLKVTAKTEHSRASYTVTGNDNLAIGENTINVKVVAENGTTRVYKIVVVRSDSPEKMDASLKSLIIEDVNLGQDFDSNVTEYNAGDITVKAKTLNVLAYANNEKAKVEILGNENLTIGEHTITIRVTSENGQATRDYIIKFNKLYEEDEEISALSTNVKSEPEDGMLSSLWEIVKENAVVLLLYLFIWVEFIQVVYLYEKMKKKKKKVL